MNKPKTFEEFLLELEAPKPADHKEEIKKKTWKGNYQGMDGFTWHQMLRLERTRKNKEAGLDEIPPKQSHRIIRKFGGVRALAAIFRTIGIKRSEACLYKWNYRGGHIPAHAWKDIFIAARVAGVRLTSEDLDPRESFLNALWLQAFPDKVPKRKNRKKD